MVQILRVEDCHLALVAELLALAQSAEGTVGTRAERFDQDFQEACAVAPLHGSHEAFNVALATRGFGYRRLRIAADFNEACVRRLPQDSRAYGESRGCNARRSTWLVSQLAERLAWSVTTDAGNWR